MQSSSSDQFDITRKTETLMDSERKASQFGKKKKSCSDILAPPFVIACLVLTNYCFILVEVVVKYQIL